MIRILWKTLPILSILLLTSCKITQDDDKTYRGKISIKDGDSFTLGNKLSVRLWGIDAPELAQTCVYEGKAQACGKQSAAALQKLAGNQEVICTQQDIDQYERIIAICVTTEGVELNEAMVKQGWAVDYTHYSGAKYRLLEQEAFQAQRGMWQYDHVQSPREWRKDNPR